MKKVRLINEPNTIENLSEALLSFEKKHINARQECINYWKNTINDLKKLNTQECKITWNNLHMFENIQKIEALFLLLALPTDFLITNSKFNPFYHHNFCPENSAMDKYILGSAEMMSLDRSGLIFKPRWRMDNRWNHTVEVENFINWTLKSGLTYLIDNENVKTEHSNKHLNKLNEQKKEAEIHNSVIAITSYLELQKHKKNRTINSIFNDDKFYNGIHKNLIAITEDGDKPSKNTIKNYLYRYKSLIESFTN